MRLDIRTKLILLFLASVSVFLANTTWFETAVIAVLALLQIMGGRGVCKKGFLLLYFSLVLIQYMLFPVLPHSLSVFLSVPVIQMRKMFPVLMAFMLIIQTTKVSELIATMTKMQIAKPITITVAVTLRYFPAIGEEWRYIRDAMRLRPIWASNPFGTLAKRMESFAVPLLISASKTADELSAAAITRGIDNPLPGTCRNYRPLRFSDYVVMIISLFLVVVSIWVRIKGL